MQVGGRAGSDPGAFHMQAPGQGHGSAGHSALSPTQGPGDLADSPADAEAAGRREEGPYHDLGVLRDVFVAGRVQHHPAGICVQAVDVEHSILDVATRPLQDLAMRAERKTRPGVTPWMWERMAATA